MPYTRLSRLSLKYPVRNERDESGDCKHSLLGLWWRILVRVYPRHQEGMHVCKGVDRAAKVSSVVNKGVGVEVPEYHDPGSENRIQEE
jgi:hypothetical protein